VVISAVPSASYKVKTEWLKDGCVCVNVASEKNFDVDVRDKVMERFFFNAASWCARVVGLRHVLVGVTVHPCGREDYHFDAVKKPVSRGRFDIVYKSTTYSVC
jgi:hypothetical protein